MKKNSNLYLHCNETVTKQDSSITKGLFMIMTRNYMIIWFITFFLLGCSSRTQIGSINPQIPKWSASNGIDQYGVWVDLKVGNVVQRFRWIKSGEFIMGTPKYEIGRNDNENEHHVMISHGFWLADSECTWALWKEIMGSIPTDFSDDLSKPVVGVNWIDSNKFLKLLNVKLKIDTFRLPTEAEWEYACRAGTRSMYSFGDAISPDQVNCKFEDSKTNRNTTVPAKSLPPNPWGLHEMHGNVWEWCSDYDSNYPCTSVTDPKITVVIKRFSRIDRGGSFDYDPLNCRSGTRNSFGEECPSLNIGFRIACSE